MPLISIDYGQNVWRWFGHMYLLLITWKKKFIQFYKNEYYFIVEIYFKVNTISR